MEYILIPTLVLLLIISAMVICYLGLMIQRIKKDRDYLQEQLDLPVPVLEVTEYHPDTLRFSKAIPKEIVDSVTPEKLYDILTTDFIYSNKEIITKYINIDSDPRAEIIPNHLMYDMELRVLRKI